MSNEDFTKALTAIEEYTDQIREEFQARQDEDEHINLETVGDLLDSLGPIFGLDFESAKEYFSKDNATVENYFNLDAMSYNDFVEILQMWMKDELKKTARKEESEKGEENENNEDQGEQQEAEEKGEEEAEAEEQEEKEEKEEQEEQEEAEQEQNERNDTEEERRNDTEEKEEEREEQGHARHDKIFEEEPSHIVAIEPHFLTETGDRLASENNFETTPTKSLGSVPQNYAKNRAKLNELLIRNKKKYREMFKERQDKETKKLPLKAYFSFLKECLSYDNPTSVLEKKADEEDFMSSEENYHKLQNLVTSFFIYEKGMKPGFDVRAVSLTFDECFDVLDYWFRTDSQVSLVDGVKPDPEPEMESYMVPLESRREQVPTRNSHYSGVNQSMSGKHDVKSMMIDTVAKYRQMIAECDNEVERDVLQATVDTMLNKLAQLENGDVSRSHSHIRREQNTRLQEKKEEKRMKALRDVFDFYCKQQLSGGKPLTFDTLGRQFNSVNLGKFSVILKNYRIKYDQFKLKELFKKVANNSDALTFDEFITLFYKIAKDAELITEVKVYKHNPEIMKEYKPDSYKTPSNSSYKASSIASSNKKDEFGLKRKGVDKVEALWEHMGLYNGMYRKGMHTVQLAFNSHDKQTFRIPIDTITNKMKAKASNDSRLPEEIKEELMLRNEFRKEVKDIKLTEKSLLRNFKDSPSKSPRPTVPKMDKKELSYAAMKALKTEHRLFPEKKMTLKEIGKANYNDLKGLGFNPRDLIDENEDEDNMYLADFNLTKPKLMDKEDKVIKSAETIKDVKPKRIPGKYSMVLHTETKRTESVPPVPNRQKAVSAVKKPKTSIEVDYLKNYNTGPYPPVQQFNAIETPNTVLSQHYSAKNIGTNPNLKMMYPQLGQSQSSKHIHQPTQNIFQNPSAFQNPSVYQNPQMFQNPSMMPPNGGYYQQFPPTMPVYLNQGYYPPHPSNFAQPNGYMQPNGYVYPEQQQQQQQKQIGANIGNRAMQVHQNSKARQNEIMQNVVNNYNTRIEQGLRVVRK